MKQDITDKGLKSKDHCCEYWKGKMCLYRLVWDHWQEVKIKYCPECGNRT